jgi:hypothetical protein
MDLSTIDARKALAKKWATVHLLNPLLVAAVADHESQWNPWAVRFEEGFEKKYIKPAIPAMPTTRELTLAMSFGLMQIIGETAVEAGFQGRFLTELCDPDTGMDFGCRKLRKCLNRNPDSVRDTLLEYNGGKNLGYPDLVLPLMAKYE